MNTELRTAISAKGDTIEELTGGFWYLEAPEDIQEPYAVFSFVTDISSRDSGTKFEDFYLQINNYDLDADNVEAIKDKLIRLFEDSESSYNLPSYYVISIVWQFSRSLKLGHVYQIITQYKIELQKNRGEKCQ